MPATTRIAALCCLLLLGSLQVYAEEKPGDRPADAADKVDPLVGAAAGAIGAAAGLPISAATGGIIPVSSAATAVANKVIAADSAGKALGALHGKAGALVGGLFAGHAGKLNGLATAHKLAGQALVDIVTTINSLHIAGTNLAVGAAGNALTGLMGNIRGEALAIGNIYTQLLGEFGRAVGAGLSAVETLSGSGLAFLNPIALGVDALELHLGALISFLQGAVDASVAGPARAALVGPFIGTLQAVQALLGALQAALLGPAGGVLGGLDGALGAAVDAAGGAIAGAIPGAGGSTAHASQLIGTALNLVGQLIN